MEAAVSDEKSYEKKISRKEFWHAGAACIYCGNI